MAFARRLLILVVTAAVCALVGFAAGGRVGFWEGYLVARTEQIIAGSLIVGVLRTHDEGKCEAGRGILEIMVDSALIAEWEYGAVPREPPFYAPSKPYRLDLKRSLRVMANYRKAHAERTHESIRETVFEVVARYSDPPASK